MNYLFRHFLPCGTVIGLVFDSQRAERIFSEATQLRANRPLSQVQVGRSHQCVSGTQLSNLERVGPSQIHDLLPEIRIW